MSVHGPSSSSLGPCRWGEDGKLLSGPFVPAGTQKLAERPSKLISWEMMKSLVALVLKDWGGADVTIFENHEDCWVIKVGVLGRVRGQRRDLPVWRQRATDFQRPVDQG